MGTVLCMLEQVEQTSLNEEEPDEGMISYGSGTRQECAEARDERASRALSRNRPVRMMSASCFRSLTHPLEVLAYHFLTSLTPATAPAVLQNSATSFSVKL